MLLQGVGDDPGGRRPGRVAAGRKGQVGRALGVQELGQAARRAQLAGALVSVLAGCGGEGVGLALVGCEWGEKLKSMGNAGECMKYGAAVSSCQSCLPHLQPQPFLFLFFLWSPLPTSAATQTATPAHMSTGL